MNVKDSYSIEETLSDLKIIKSSLFFNLHLNMKSTIETCRLIDVIMFPLYYIWEYKYHKNVSELNMEKHLMKSYKRFLQAPIINTWQFYSFIKLGIPYQIHKKTREKVLSIYESLLM